MQMAESNNNLAFIDSFSLKLFTKTLKETGADRFYQQIVSLIIKSVNTEQALTDVGDRLTAIAEYAYTLRQMEAVELVSALLINLPMPDQYKSAGRYYQALCIKRRGAFDEARAMLERVVKESPPWYRVRSLMAIAAIAFDSSDFPSALSLYIEAGHSASHTLKFDPLIALGIQRMMAIIKSVEGDHFGALANLDNLFPLARAVASQYPAEYYAYLNSLAVEMMEVGRIEEAENASRLVLASPYAAAYPEWSETKDEIATKAGRASRSIVAIESSVAEKDSAASVPALHENIKRISENAAPAIYHPAPEPCEDKAEPESEPVHQPASVLLFPVRNQSADKKTTGHAKITPEELSCMTVSQKRARVLALVYDEETPEKVYDDLLQAAGLVVAEEEGPKELDFDSPSVLEETVRLWVNGDLDPENFASVISALRDCDDDLRRINIMDRMISYAFGETREAMKSEDDWRKRVESRLKPETD